MRGIDEETLIVVRESLAAEGLNTDVIDALISLKIKELNPWLPLDEFLMSGFVGKCWVFWGKHVVESEYDTNGFWYVYRYLDQNTITHVQPIHKPEPPQDEL